TRDGGTAQQQYRHHPTNDVSMSFHVCFFVLFPDAYHVTGVIAIGLPNGSVGGQISYARPVSKPKPAQRSNREPYEGCNCHEGVTSKKTGHPSCSGGKRSATFRGISRLVRLGDRLRADCRLSPRYRHTAQ